MSGALIQPPSIPNMVSLKRFNIDLTTENSHLIQQAIDSVYNNGDRGIAWPNVLGGIPLDAANPLYFYDDMVMQGARTYCRAVGSTYPDAPTFPSDGGAMFCLVQPGTPNGVARERYGREIGRTTPGTGLTANLTVAANAVTAATVVNGTTNWKAGDEATFTVGSATCTFTVGVSTHRGAATTLTIKSSTTNWGAPSNPVTMTSSKGTSFQDRLIDPATMANRVVFRDFIFNGGFTDVSARLTGQKQYNAIGVRGCLDVIFENCHASYFPNSPFSARDYKRLRSDNCSARASGWWGVFEAARLTDRNAANHVGLYLTDPSCNSLNSDETIVRNFRAIDIGDSAIQFAFAGNLQAENIYCRGWGGIAIEGEASTYGTLDTFENNGGVEIPNRARFINLTTDGRMVGTRLAPTAPANYAAPNYVSTRSYQLISWACANQSQLEISGWYGGDCQNYALKYFQNNDSSTTSRTSLLKASNVMLERVNYSSDDTVRASGAFEVLNVAQVHLRQFTAREIGAGIGFKIRGRHNYFDANDVTLWGADTTVGATTTVGAGIDIDISQSFAFSSLTLTGYKARRMQTGLFRLRVNGTGNTSSYREINIEADGLDCNLNSTTGSRRPIVDLQANAGTNDADGNLNYNRLSVDLKYSEASTNTPSTTPLVNVANKSTTSADSIVVKVNAPNMDPTTAVGRLLSTVAPTTIPTFIESPAIGLVSVAQVATTIARAYREGQLFSITGNNGSARFTDLVMFTGSSGMQVVSSGTGSGSPAARTYSILFANGTDATRGYYVQLVMASGTYPVLAEPMKRQ